MGVGATRARERLRNPRTRVSPMGFQICLRCGRSLPRIGTHGLCPRCLMRRALRSMRTEADPVVAGGADLSAVGWAACRLFAGYEVVRELGRGRSGVVYLARRGVAGTAIALKVLSGRDGASAEQVDRFLAGVRAAVRLDHAHIVPVHGGGYGEGRGYLALRWIEGETVVDRVRAGWKPAPSWVVSVMIRLCRAVGYAHRLGVAHGALHLGNVLLDRWEVPWLTGYGLSGWRGERGQTGETGEGSPGVPRERGVERAMREGAALESCGPGPVVAADIRGLGGILSELLTARRRGPEGMASGGSWSRAMVGGGAEWEWVGVGGGGGSRVGEDLPALFGHGAGDGAGGWGGLRHGGGGGDRTRAVARAVTRGADGRLGLEVGLRYEERARIQGRAPIR